MPYQSSYNTAHDFSTTVLGWLNVETTDVPAVEVGANVSQALLDAVVEGEAGDQIEIIDDISGMSALFVILGYEITLSFIGDVRCRWSLAYAIVGTAVLMLDVDGMDALDTDEAKLGF